MENCKNENDSKLTRHHILPRSRQKGKPKQGICKVKKLKHELYHHLFGNMYPWEILEFLNKEFWNNMYNIKIKEKSC
jgi:hypothetical protein